VDRNGTCGTHLSPWAEAALPVPALDPAKEYGPCATRLDNQPTPSDRPWRYGHAASIEGAHWDIYAGEGIDGWLVGMVTTEADAALIVEAVNGRAALPVPALDTLRTALDILDVIDGIVDDTHPEGDGCPLCNALDDLRAALEGKTP